MDAAAAAFWATVLGAAIGVVAGAIIQYGVDFLVRRRTEHDQRAALKKEMQYNLMVVGDLITESRNLRNAFNGDLLRDYFGILGFDRGNFTQSNALLNSGKLYKWFAVEDLKKLQRIAFLMNPGNANWVANNIKLRCESSKDPKTYDKGETGKFIKFIEDQISELQVLLNGFTTLL